MPKPAKKKISYNHYFVHYAYCLGIIALLILTSVNINKFFESQKVLGVSVDVSPLRNEKTYWENIVSQNPSYTDGYLELAKVSVELGDKNEAITYITKALILNPNSEKITSVQKALGL